MSSQTRDIVLTIDLDASPEEVFRAVTDGTEIAKWLAPEAKVTPPAGNQKGNIWISWGEGMAAGAEIEVWDPPRKMTHQFGAHPETKAPLYAEWSIEAKEGGTSTLRLVHSGFSASADWDGEFESHARGWTLMIANLRHYLGRHKNEPAVHLIFSANLKAQYTKVWAALVDKLGLKDPKEGEPFSISPAGEQLSGFIEFSNGRDLALIVKELDDGLLRFQLEGGRKPEGPTFAYGYVIAYGDAAGRAKELQASMGKLIKGLPA